MPKLLGSVMFTSEMLAPSAKEKRRTSAAGVSALGTCACLQHGSQISQPEAYIMMPVSLVI